MLKFGLIGQSLSHSFSQTYFTERFLTNSVEAVYQNCECRSLDEVKALLESADFSGFNVTIPYKEQVIPLLDEVDDTALQVGAVNTICKQKGKWVGYNTDVFGFKQMIKPFFKSHHERAIILGTGGASKAVKYVLESLGSEVIFISRNPKHDNEFSYHEMNNIMMKACPVIVNTTPVGTFPETKQVVNIPYEYLNDRHLVIDLIYNPLETQFLSNAKLKGATILNGLTMLHQQAEKAWEIWLSNSD